MNYSKLKAPLAILMSFMLQPAIAQEAANPFSDLVRETNDRFQDVEVAIAEGYGSIACVSGHDGGGMGIHYVNGDYLMNDDNTVDVSRPEALMYEPMANGSLVLVGAEFLTFTGPVALGGHLFSYSVAPNRYGLDAFYSMHVWAWKENPNGTFAHMNPNVSCDAVSGS